MKIKDLTLFQTLNEDEIHRSMICSGSEVRVYKKNQYIFQQDEEPKRLYLILSGQILLGQVNFMGRQTYVEYLGEGQCFGETELFLERQHRRYFAIAKGETKLLSVSRHFLYHTCEKNCEHHSKIIFNMMHIFAQEADKNFQKIQLLTCGSLRQRIALYLQQQSDGKSKVVLPMNREDLAAYLNAARPSLSRELSAMQKAGILEISGRKTIHILDFGLLQDEIDGDD